MSSEPVDLQGTAKRWSFSHFPRFSVSMGGWEGKQNLKKEGWGWIPHGARPDEIELTKNHCEILRLIYYEIKAKFWKTKKKKYYSMDGLTLSTKLNY